MSEVITLSVTTAVLLVVVPIVVYISAKLWSYGWLKGKYQFWKDHPKSNRKGSKHGNTERT